MCCFITLFLLVGPRVALIFMWLFSDLVTRAFPNFLFPLLGTIFLPFTTIFYVLAYQPAFGIDGFGWFFVILGLIIDISSYGGGWWGNRGRLRR